MRLLLQRLAEAAPAPGSKAWLAGVRKWWGQWVKGAARVAQVRDPQDRPQVQAWLAEGEQRLTMLVDALVRQVNLSMDPSLAQAVIGYRARQYKAGTARLKAPRSYVSKVGDTAHRFKTTEGELVHAHLQAALDNLYQVTSQEQSHWAMAQGPESQRRWGTTRDLDEWQSYVEMLPHEITGIDADVLAALRKLGAYLEGHAGAQDYMATAIPLDYDLGGVKVISDPGALHDLHLLLTPEADQDPLAMKLSRATMQSVQDGLRLAQRALQQRGFGKLWAGRIFVLPPARAITGTAAKTGQTFKAGGHYGAAGDDIVLNPRASWEPQQVAEVVVHELGHRYWYKVMRAGARARFSAWFDPRGKADQEREGPQAAYVPAPTAYGAESAVEEFAETFAAYVLGRYEGMTLTGPQKARFEALALGRAAQSEAAAGALGALLREFADRAGDNAVR